MIALKFLRWRLFPTGVYTLQCLRPLSLLLYPTPWNHYLNKLKLQKFQLFRTSSFNIFFKECLISASYCRPILYLACTIFGKKQIFQISIFLFLFLYIFACHLTMNWFSGSRFLPLMLHIKIGYRATCVTTVWQHSM